MARVRTQDFSYELPKDLVAYAPVERREDSRLMVVNRSTGKFRHTHFAQLPAYLRKGDLLVVNQTRVIKARLLGEKVPTGGAVDLLLLRETEPRRWEALVSPSRRIHEGTEIELGRGHRCRVGGRVAGGKRLVEFETADVMRVLEEVGKVPLPPYIKRAPEGFDEERYQTVYARMSGSVAAPTAGLHFSETLLAALERKGVRVARLTLHVGLGSFRPVKTDDPREHTLEPEYFEIDQECADAVNEARRRGARVVAVGTTSVRALETAADMLAEQGAKTVKRQSAPSGSRRVEPAGDGSSGPLAPARGWTEKFIIPPYRFRVADALVTNFHLPCSTLIMLVAAFAGRRLVLKAYAEAIERRYRFYSYGDAMLIV
ncbi:MAG: tRNA preQ1(34) S-adenosylmethionine ribosyltransferase-isomerase QueA [bacterium]